MLVDVESHHFGPLFLVLHEHIVEIIKLRQLLVECHELLVAHVALNFLVMGLVEEVALLDQF